MKNLTKVLLGVVIILLISIFAYRNYFQAVEIPKSFIDSDIPIFKGLKYNEDIQSFQISGNKMENIYDFYMKEMQKNGWELQYEQLRAAENGFETRWNKRSKQELSILGYYDDNMEETNVILDLNNIENTDPWLIGYDSVCVKKDNKEKCFVLNETEEAMQFTELVNNSIGITEDNVVGEFIADIKYSNNVEELNTELLYNETKDVYYLQSLKGIQEIKPEKSLYDFLEMINTDEN